MENTVEQFPQIVGRLESLQTIHEESAKIANKVSTLTENQAAVLKNLEENQELLKKVRFILFILLLFFLDRSNIWPKFRNDQGEL